MKYADLSLSPSLVLTLNHNGEIRRVQLNRISAQVLAAAIIEFVGPPSKGLTLNARTFARHISGAPVEDPAPRSGPVRFRTGSVRIR